MSAATPRLIVLVLDGFSPRHCRPELTPNLISLAEQGAWARQGGRAVLPSSTYPNHASIATGARPIEHGILANKTFTEAGIRPARDVGARGVTFLDAAREAGLGTAVAVGDANILGVIGAKRCDRHWPPQGVIPPDTPTLRGYAADSATLRALQAMLEEDADVVLCQLDNTDGVSHLFGPDSPEAIAQHRAADAIVAELVGALRSGRRWNETLLAVISDHSQITADLEAPPLDLPAALSHAGIAAEVIEEGSGALVRCDATAAARAVIAALDGVAGVRDFAPRVLYAHARPGRGFAAGRRLPRGIHGCPETTPTLCLATGGHSGLGAVRRAFDIEIPTTATLTPLLAKAIGLRWPAAKS
jgi:hypothetical protein